MSDGMQCECAAWSANECCCGADWTPKELIDARARIKELEAENAEWQKLKDPVDLHLNLLRGFPCHLDRTYALHLAGATNYDDIKQEVARLSNHIRAIASHHFHQDDTEYHAERRDFALSIFTKGETA
jgi:hypothetical protein